MIYRTDSGRLWDPSVIWYKDSYWAVMMYGAEPVDNFKWTGCMLASSTDGVHWKDEGEVIRERELDRGCQFFKAFFGRLTGHFVLDHGVATPDGQDILRFYESYDLREWKYLFSSSPDSRWYGVKGEPHRWDHMYMLPKEEDNPSAGYWGHVVAVPKAGTPPGVGMMQSADGRDWEVLPPAPIDWPDVLPARDHFEWGGCERIGDKYYLIGGTNNYISKGYSMYTLVSDDPCGPFRPDVEAFRLCGTSTDAAGWGVSFLAGWSRGNDELLISNYVSVPSGVWMLPLRKAVVDADGHLRMGWWKGNDALNGEPIALESDSGDVAVAFGSDGYRMSWMKDTFDLTQGVVIEGNIRAMGRGKNAAAGFIFDEGTGQMMAVLMGVGPKEERETHIGRLSITAEDQSFTMEDVTGKGCATVRGLDDIREHRFRLLLRFDLFELYIDDLLVQTYVYKPQNGRLGFLARNAQSSFRDIKAFQMSLRLPTRIGDGVAGFPGS